MDDIDEKMTKYLLGHNINIEEADGFLSKLDEKVWINPSLQEHRTVEEHTIKFVQEFLSEVNSKKPDLKLELIKSGSYYSNHRVGRPYEFDFMLVLPTPDCEVDRCSKSVQYYIRTQKEAAWNWIPKDQWSRIKWKDGDNSMMYIDTSVLMKYVIQPTFYTCLDKLETKWDIQKFGIKFGSPAYNVILRLGKKAILIDLVPCIKFPKHQINQIPRICPYIISLFADSIRNTDIWEGNFVCADNKVETCSDTNRRCCSEYPDEYKHSEESLKELLDGPKESSGSNGNIHEEKELRVTRIFSNNLYLVFSDSQETGSSMRLSTSLIEREIFQHVGDKLLQALRIVKYLVQTFHIPPYAHLSIAEQTLSDQGEPFGLSSAIASRYLTMVFLHFVLCSYYQENNPGLKPFGTLNYHLSSMVFLLLCSIRSNLWSDVEGIAVKCLFPDVDFSSKPRKMITDVFRLRNMQTIRDFILQAIKIEDIDIFTLECPDNRIQCEQCWGPRMKDILESIPFVMTYPNGPCLMHKYIAAQS